MENQQKIQASLQALCKDKTLIIIAHRLSTVIDCEQIIVIEDGKVNAMERMKVCLKLQSCTGTCGVFITQAQTGA
jgi:ATP-binding cassette subfamily B protein